jgi:error-prone DNA polymerase
MTDCLVELRASSAFSFLAAASQPEDLATRAAVLGLRSLALADEGGVYGIPRFVKAAKAAGIRPIVGATVRLAGQEEGVAEGRSVARRSESEPDARSGGASKPSVPCHTAQGFGGPRDAAAGRRRPSQQDRISATPSSPEIPGRPSGPALALLCEDLRGWRNLCELLTEAHRGSGKGACTVTHDQLERFREGLVVLAGGLDGPVLRAGRRSGRDAARAEADRLAGAFGPGRLYLDLQRHGDPAEEHGNRLLVDLAASLGLPLAVSGDVRYDLPERAPVQDVLLCLLHRTPLDAAGERLPRCLNRHLRSPSETARAFSDLPRALAGAADLADRLRFDLADLGYTFPRFPAPPGETEFSLLHELVHQGVRDRYRPVTPAVMRQVTHELDLIQKLDLAGYFLLVHDIVRFCQDRRILAQGRGSAANSIVCYALGATAIDPIAYGLLFERFLSEERGEWPDIDLDLPSGDDREAVIQYVYRHYGDRSVGMTAAVYSFQGRSASREVGKVLGLDPDRLDRLSRLVGHYDFRVDEGDFLARVAEAGLDASDHRVARFIEIWRGIRGLPRHLSQHNGGLVICGGRLDRVVPLEPATMPGRTVIQWDKDDIADLRIIKVDLLGLGMLAALRETLDLAKSVEGAEVDLARLPPDDPAVYAMLRAADTVGVFQVESRAQMATLPRMKPDRFYDLVVEVAIIRPGPIVGKMVSPYLQRRQGREPVTYAHPCLEPILARTLGVPLFQEQLMRIAMVAAGFTGGQAEELRRAMGSRRSRARMDRMAAQLREGMTSRGIPPAAQEEIVRSIESFALYGFPESHAASFALIAYASAYLKVHHPAAFYTALLNQWPMGFYHPSTVIRDAERHGLSMLPVDVTESGWDCTLPDIGRIRLGLKYVKGLSRATADRIVAERRARPFSGVTDLAVRTEASVEEVATLASVGALAAFGRGRRDALWQTLASRQARGLLAGAIREDPEPALPPMTPADEMAADYRGLGLSTGPHPVTFLRPDLLRRGVLTAAELPSLADGRWVRVAGMVIVRQRPGTAKGFYFATLEDETGLSNVAVTPDVFLANRTILSTAPFLVVEGRLQSRDGVVSVKGERFARVDVPVDHRGRSFR